MFERYSLPKNEEIKRYSTKTWQDFLVKYFSGKENISLNESMTVTKNHQLGYTRFVQGKGSEVTFELLVSNEANDIIDNSGPGQARKGIKNEIKKIAKDPFGDKSIDPDVNSSRAKLYRSVNAFSQDLEEKLGIPLAIKGSTAFPLEDSGREDLFAQFCFMKQSEQEWEQLPADIKEIIKICKVYAVLRYKVPGPEKYKEWLIMERVINPKQVREYNIYNNNWNPPVLEPCFKIVEHPLLAKIVEAYSKNYKEVINSLDEPGYYKWYTLEEVLQDHGLTLSDFAGRNVLYSENTDPSNRQYTIIDQRHNFRKDS